MNPPPLHPLEFRILVAVARGAGYGTAIVREIEAAEGARTRLYPANLFRRIRDLRERGLLSSAPTPEGADPRRGYLALTDAGRTALIAETRRFRDMVRDAEALDLLGES